MLEMLTFITSFSSSSFQLNDWQREEAERALKENNGIIESAVSEYFLYNFRARSIYIIYMLFS